MARVTVSERDVRVRFSWWERPLVRRSEVVVPLTAIRAIEVVDQPLAHTRGGRAGLVVLGVLKVGVWGLGAGVRQLVSVRRSTPAVRIALDGGPVDELLVSTRHTARVVESVDAARTR